ncbi:Serine threonine- phosphatase 6 regulatory ankyrin repeat subunit A isoform B [Chlorella sorokiniana]|uniref:Serine threonine-phosphatase 6 regulatory ankyrin repeat subunit A isoform B n=1 Tax=Chlorella sorokiniana TaxID=3076 RepID=A0A2P6TI48_CHLSO|nr:Serine threonine- phosphatase 6 regulatory ankyrin repeat subunit A isoform B [Chlorella sorokiniana]|eukprot:PRW33960.1 Serine threonine- phosphatase 6 regulatory ankyrin repeat subunit A isoform B [Chlorella sorokiniana]
MEQQAPASPADGFGASPADGSGASPSGAEGQGGQDPMQPSPSAGLTLLEQLHLALYQGDRNRFRSLLPLASAEDLAATEPLSLYHAAALEGNAEAVQLLAAAGAPAAAADTICNCCQVVPKLDLFFFCMWHKEFRATAAGIAIARGHSDALAALLQAGAAPDAPSERLPEPACVERGSPLAPLDQVVRCYSSLGPEKGDAMLQQLLAAGVSITQLRMDTLYSCGYVDGGSLARMLLRQLLAASQSGQFAMPHTAEECTHLLETAALCGATDALEHFAAQLLSAQPPAHMLDAVAHRVLDGAVTRCNMQVLELAAQAAHSRGTGAAPASATAQLLGPRWADQLSNMLCSAVIMDHPAAVRLLLLDSAAQAELAHNSNDLFLQAVRFDSARRGADNSLLSKDQERYYSQEPRAVHPWDAQLLPMLECLLAAGYRPRTYAAGEVPRLYPLGAVRRAVKSSFDPVQQDGSLQLGRINRWLWLAIEHPLWAPAADTHNRFLPSFRAAARTLLLVAHRGGSTGASVALSCEDSGGSGGSSEAATAVGSSGATANASEQPLSWAAGLASLPRDVLLHIVGLAAYPLSAWAPLEPQRFA